jgi:hypothetical protein
MSAPENKNKPLDAPVSNPPSDSVVAPAVESAVVPAVVESGVALTNVVVSENNVNDSNKLLGIDFSNNKYSDLLSNEDVKSVVTLLTNHVDAVENIASAFKSLHPVNAKDVPVIIHILNKIYSVYDKEKELVSKLTPLLLLHAVKAVLVILIKENKIVVADPDTVVADIKKIVDELVSVEEAVVKVKSCSCLVSSCWSYKSSKCCN